MIKQMVKLMPYAPRVPTNCSEPYADAARVLRIESLICSVELCVDTMVLNTLMTESITKRLSKKIEGDLYEIRTLLKLAGE